MTAPCSSCTTSNRRFIVIYLVPFIGLMATGAWAEETTNGNNLVDIKPSVTLDPIIVTARGVAEDQLETPFAVNTITTQDIEDEQHITMEDALRSQPSVDIHNGGNTSYSMLWMRGTGSLSLTSLDDNSVDIRVDGISHGKTGLARNLIDIEQIEVAKGPQGTLLGSSAEAGSIVVKTRDPVDYLEGKVGVGVGSHHQKYAEAVLNLPITDNVSMRVAGMKQQRDNVIIRKEDGKPLNQKDNQGVQAKLRWHDDADENNVVLALYQDKQTNNVPVLQNNFETFEVQTFDLPHESDSTAEGVILLVESDIGFANLDSQTSYHTYEGDILRPFLPPEMLPLQYGMFRIPAADQPIYNDIFSNEQSNRQHLIEELKQVSQELKLVSKPESDVKWVAGMYLAHKDRKWINDGKVSLEGLPNGFYKNYLGSSTYNGDTNKTFDTTTKALFGEITYPATNSLDVIAGIRVANEKQVHHASWQGNSNNSLGTTVKSDSKTLDETATTGRLGASLAITPNWRLYALQSRGHKFGGFADYDTNVAYGNPVAFYKPTKIDASEVGTKYRSADNRLNLNLALYQNTMTDDHMTVLGAPPEYKSQTTNVDSRSRGIEVSADWHMTDNWQINTELAYTDAVVTDDSNVPAPGRPGTLPLTAEGNRMPQVPKFSGSVGVRYSNDLPAGLPLFNNAQWFVATDYRYVGKRFAQAYNGIELEEYGLVDASIGLSSADHEVSIWGKNLTDEKYKTVAIYPMNVGILGPDRSYGIKYSYYY